MPSQHDRGLKSRSGMGGGMLPTHNYIRQSTLQHAATVALKNQKQQQYMQQYQQPNKISHKQIRKGQQQQQDTYLETRGTGDTTTLYEPSTYIPTHTQEELSYVDDAEQHTADCLCTICSCGKHACPPTPHLAHYDPNLASEHHAQYIPKKTTTTRIPINYKIPKSVPFEGNSIYQDSFKAHPFNASRLVRTSAELHDTGITRNNAPFLGETTNQSAYKRWNSRPAESTNKTHRWTPLDEDRQFQSEYRSQHDKKPIPQTQRGTQPWQIPTSMPFQGDSTSHSDYHAHPDGYPSRSYQPHPYRTWLPDNRDFQSDAMANYTPKSNPICPAGPLARGVTKHHGQHGHIHVEKGMNGTWTRSQQL